MTRATEPRWMAGRSKNAVIALILIGLFLTGLAAVAVNYVYQNHIVTDCGADCSSSDPE